MELTKLTKSACSLSFVFVFCVVFMHPFVAWKADASGLSLTHCDEVCGIAKEATFKDDDQGTHSDYSAIEGDYEDFVVQPKNNKTKETNSNARKKREGKISKSKKSEKADGKINLSENGNDTTSGNSSKAIASKKKGQHDKTKSKSKQDYSDDEEEEEEGDDDDANEEDNRIVNGYDPNERPWLAFIMVSGGACGGALVNKKFVITAAHCFCRQVEPVMCKKIKSEGLDTHAPAYDLKKHVKIYLGLNNVDIKYKDRHKENIYYPVKVTIKSGWVYGETFSPDMAIVELHKEVEFVPDVISPLCIPSSKGFPDRSTKTNPVKGYVAGWGAQNSQCDTNANGPDPFTMCKFPFMYKGQTYSQCAHVPPPSSENSVCNEFFKYAASDDGKKEGILSPSKMATEDSFSIYFWDATAKAAKETTCYSQSTGQDGWCGSCYSGELNPGTEGFCDKYGGKTETNTRTEMSKPKSDKNWGWCAEWCKNTGGQSLSQTLKETRLDFLTQTECNDMGTGLSANSTIEICTGKKTSWPKVRKFKRVIDKSSKKVYFQSTGTVKNYLGFGEKQKYDFYLGGTDSCQGDSGGPLYLWNGQGDSRRAFMVGIVSRGTGCANLNQFVSSSEEPSFFVFFSPSLFPDLLCLNCCRPAWNLHTCYISS